MGVQPTPRAGEEGRGVPGSDPTGGFPSGNAVQVTPGGSLALTSRCAYPYSQKPTRDPDQCVYIRLVWGFISMAFFLAASPSSGAPGNSIPLGMHLPEKPWWDALEIVFVFND